MGGVPLLPEKLSRSQERSGILELPTHNIAPLVDLQRKISVTANPFREERIHDRFTSRADSDRLGQIGLSTFLVRYIYIRNYILLLTYMYVEDVFVNTHTVTHATSGAKPST